MATTIVLKGDPRVKDKNYLLSITDFVICKCLQFGHVYYSVYGIDSSGSKSDDKILGLSELKAKADDKLNEVPMIEIFFNPLPHKTAMYISVENILRKGEIACNRQFLLFSQCFLPYMVLIFHFKCTLKCRLLFVSIWTSQKFCRLVMC